jgi:hypothetical protein
MGFPYPGWTDVDYAKRRLLQEGAQESFDRWQALSQVWLDQILAASPRGLRETIRGGDSLQALPRETAREEAPGSGVLGVREDFPRDEEHSQDVFPGMLDDSGSRQRAQALEGSLDDQDVRVVREQVPERESASEDLQSIMREQVGLEPAAYLADRLRCAGNGVVPVVAAVAFTTLLKRYGRMK